MEAITGHLIAQYGLAGICLIALGIVVKYLYIDQRKDAEQDREARENDKAQLVDLALKLLEEVGVRHNACIQCRIDTDANLAEMQRHSTDQVNEFYKTHRKEMRESMDTFADANNAETEAINELTNLMIELSHQLATSLRDQQDIKDRVEKVLDTVRG